MRKEREKGVPKGRHQGRAAGEEKGPLTQP